MIGSQPRTGRRKSSLSLPVCNGAAAPPAARDPGAAHDPGRHTVLPVLVFCAVSLLQPRGMHANEAQHQLFSEDGYRIAEFRATVPCSVPGATTVGTADVARLLDKYGAQIVLIDVLPQAPRPEKLPTTSLWLPPARNNIPASIWLPNVGYGRLSDALSQYYRSNLEAATNGEFDRPIVVYCLADCWMSWNAAKRAAEYGYTQVYWYPEGTTDWEAAGLPVARSTPVPLQPRVPSQR